MKFGNLKEAEAALAVYVPLSPHLTRKDTTMERIVPLMERLGNPQDRLRVIHIAGTSGKTSTSYYMAALLAATGRKVGLATSPHIDTITERIQIDGRPVSEALFCSELGVFLELVRGAQPQPSYFELLYAFTLWVLDRQKVFYAVVETGVGGLHDATNIAARADKLCIITDIGFDHTALLGKTLPAITSQKVGIVHEGNNVFMYKQAGEIMSVIEQWTERHHAPLHVTTETAERRDYGEDLSEMTEYQQRNWLLARYVYKYLQERDGLQPLTSQALRASQRIVIPARMDVKQIDGKTLVMDGAHNGQKMTAFVNSFRRLYPGAKPAVLLGVKDGKDYDELVPLLAPLAGRIITTTFETTQDLPVISMAAEPLARAFRTAGVGSVEAIPDHREAFRTLLAGPEKLCIITGSFYLIAQIRNNEQLA